MNGYQASGNLSRKLSRDLFIKMLEVALESKSFRFGRQSALAWLAIYPGDLQVSLLQANLLIAEGKSTQALPMLDRLMRLDPEAADVYRSVARNTYAVDPQRYELAVTSLVALKEGRPSGPAVKEWGTALRESRHLFDRGQVGEAEIPLKQVLSRGDAPLVAKILHLKLISQSQDAQALFRMADLYRSQCPECLQFNLYLADALMQLGNEPEAVNLLHKSMSMDASGQVAERMWGASHPYRAIWPEELSIYFELAIPADVAGRLGWNWMLPYTTAIPTNLPVVFASPEPAAKTNVNVDIPDLTPEPSREPVVHSNTAPATHETNTGLSSGQVDPTDEAEAKAPLDPARYGRGQGSVESEFEKLAHKLKKPSIGRADGRFPVYVIISSKAGLESQYGPLTTVVIDTELHRLASVVQRRTGWESLVFYPDDEKSVRQQGLFTTKERDPWKLKLAIADLDKALAKRGLMIGMMLIAGGPLVFPFHELPNPTDDFDTSVNSDNPYATMDSNYFVPEWPIGRLPGSNNEDAGPLLEQLRYLVAYHHRRIPAKKVKGLFAPLLSMFEVMGRIFAFRGEKPNYGYTAAVWRRSALAVFRPVGAPQHVMVSPPQVSGKIQIDKLLAPEVGYFNLHGSADTGEWYGQRDPGESTKGPDYPVALSPKDLHRNGHAPRVVFSEACYGGNIENKGEDNALSLKFLSLGTLAVVGSSCIAYGALSTPLIAADLLGNTFWQNIKEGRTAGEALMIAKVELVREMNKRQGYLDAEDQKTLLSFVLYGDPMVSLDGKGRLSKNQLRLKRFSFKTIEERPVRENILAPVSAKVIEDVKSVVASCLPGMENAEVRIREELGSAAYATKNGPSPKSASGESRYVVTMSKSVTNAKSVHRHYVRATVDHGKVIKVVVSR